jgi:hypothetical protein
MKLFSITAAKNKASQQLIILGSLLTLLHLSNGLFAQKDSTIVDSTKNEEPAAKEEPSLIAPSLEFITVQKSDKTIDLKAAMKAKVKGIFYKLPLLKVTFFIVNDSGEKPLGFAITDQQGKAVFNVKGDSLKTDKEGKLHFKAIFAGNKQMETTDGEVTIKRARLEIIPVKEDSLLSVKVKLIDIISGTETAVPEVAVGVFVNRLFNPLKIGEGTTDAEGEAVVEIANNLPGDSKGNINLIARLDENETYGNLEATVSQKWGMPVSDKIEKEQRALWSSHPPIWMLVTFIILMSVVWGHYLVIVIQLFRLRKEEPHLSIKATTS